MIADPDVPESAGAAEHSAVLWLSLGDGRSGKNGRLVDEQLAWLSEAARCESDERRHLEKITTESGCLLLSTAAVNLKLQRTNRMLVDLQIATGHTVVARQQLAVPVASNGHFPPS